MLLQTLSLRLGIVANKDLAQACRHHYRPQINYFLWIIAEFSIIACDVAEVLGSALALHLLFGISLLPAVGITALDTLIVLGLKGRGFRQVEAIVLGLLLTIGLCLAIELVMFGPAWHTVIRSIVPHPIESPQALFVAIGILGATVMPRNLYLHSSIVQTRHIQAGIPGHKDAVRLFTWDSVISLSFAMIVNASLLILAASAFNATGHTEVTEIQDAYHLLDPIVGSTFASVLFGIALLAAGQSSTFAGTIAGQIMLEGFLNIKIPCWQRRLITRSLALIPAFIGILWYGDAGVGKLLVLSQVVLSLGMPFTVWPLISLTSDRNLMGPFANSRLLKITAWIIFIVITAANLWLLSDYL